MAQPHVYITPDPNPRKLWAKGAEPRIRALAAAKDREQQSGRYW